MPKANALPTTHRRTLFTGAIAASILSIAATRTLAAQDQDSKILSLCEQYWRLDKALFSAEWEQSGETAEQEKIIEQKINDLADERYAVIDQIVACTASTMAGFQAKATVIKSILPGSINAFNLTNDSEEIQLVMSLMNDLTKGQTS
ncbi:hypothetical protein [Acetobacter orientalis]|uniref:hypothetical protein n=1 Tax=Acetobacter orientalis TaxID=146474 RepID=UPI0039EB51D7